MCYDIKTSLEKQLRRALLDGNIDMVTQINDKLKIFSNDEVNLYHASGFDHPKMFIYTDEAPFTPKIATWGLIPFWSKDRDSIWNKTLNARGETIFEKPVFKDSAASKRCIIYLEGFYEHHHAEKQVIPYFIRVSNHDLFGVAGLWSEWLSENGELLTTFTIVTTKANARIADIHNNPKLIEPRMPFILTEENEEVWLNKEISQQDIEGMMKPLSKVAFEAYTVGSIKGKNALGNIPEVINEVKYAVLETGGQLGLF